MGAQFIITDDETGEQIKDAYYMLQFDWRLVSGNAQAAPLPRAEYQPTYYVEYASVIRAIQEKFYIRTVNGNRYEIVDVTIRKSVAL